MFANIDTSESSVTVQTRYTTFSREVLIICLAVKHFQDMLESGNFTIYIDHELFILCFGMQARQILIPRYTLLESIYQ